MATTAKKDYEALAKKMITQPTEMKRKPTIFIYARNKKGKSTFCASAPNVLIIDPDNEGTNKLTKINPKVWPVEKWEDLDDVHKYLRLGTHTYEWVALDGLTKIQNMAHRWIMNQAEERDLDRRPNRMSPNDYGQAGKMVEQLISNFQSLKNVGLIITAQEKMTEGGTAGDEDEDAEDTPTYFLPHLQGYVAGVVNGAADIIGRLYVVSVDDIKYRDKVTQEVKTRSGLQRRLWLEPVAAYATGYRSEYASILPKYLKNPTLEKLIKLIDTGKAT